MKKNYSKILFVLFLSLLFGSYQSGAQVTITQWNFDSEVLTPTLGSGTADNLGGTTTAWASGNPSTGRGWNTTPYPEQGTNPLTAGVLFRVPTSGYSNIAITWDERHSNTAANRSRIKYTLDGTTWVDFEASEANATNTLLDGTPVGFDEGKYVTNVGAVYTLRGANFTEIPEANNNANFAIMIVTDFVDGENYGASAEGGTYGTSGTIRFDNVTFIGGSGTAPVLIANPSALTGFTYIVGSGPSEIQFTELSGNNLTPETGVITVTAPESYEISLDGANFTNSVSYDYGGGELSGEVLAIRMKAGLAAGSYSEILTISGGGANTLNVALAGNVSTGLEPALGNVILPQFIEGSVPNPNRVPFAYHATIINLLPNATYRYYNRVVLTSETATSLGAGNVIIVNPTAQTFTRLTSPNLGTAGAYGEFTTDASGSFSGWFMTEPTGNATRFKPGNELQMKILLNDGNNGTVETTYLTTPETVKVLAFSTSTADTAGTAVRGVSDFTAKNFVFLYDNTSGNGRPLYGTHIEASGIDFAAAGNQAPFYLSDVATFAGAWGGIIPNNNAAGVQRVEERSLTTGNVVNQHSADNGVWGTTDTRNPSGGVETALVINTIVGIEQIPASIGKVFTYGNILSVEFQRNATADITVFNLQGSAVASFRMNGSRQTFDLNIPAGVYMVRIASSTGIFNQKVLVK